MGFRVNDRFWGGFHRQARLTYDEIVKLADQGHVFHGKVIRIGEDYLLIGINAERLGRLNSLQLPGRLKPSDFQVGQAINVKVIRAFKEKGTNQPCFNLALAEEASQSVAGVNPLGQKRQQYEGQIVFGIYYDHLQIMGHRRPRIAFGEPQKGFLDQDVPEGALVKARVARVFEYHGEITYELALVDIVTDYQRVSDIEPFYIWKKEGLPHPGICPKSLINAWKAAYGNFTITLPPDDILVIHEGRSLKYSPYLLLLPDRFMDALDQLWEKISQKNEVELKLLSHKNANSWILEIYLVLPELPTIPIGFVNTSVMSLADKLGQMVTVRLNNTTLLNKDTFFLEAAMSNALFALVNEEAMRVKEKTAERPNLLEPAIMGHRDTCFVANIDPKKRTFASQDDAKKVLIDLIAQHDGHYNILIKATVRHGRGVCLVHSDVETFAFGSDPQGKPYEFDFTFRKLPGRHPIKRGEDRQFILIYDNDRGKFFAFEDMEDYLRVMRDDNWHWTFTI